MKFNVRMLKHGDPIPTTKPLRYKAVHGYWRLRWKVGPNQYVEVYEHRLVAGLDALHVHHINGDKSDNRPENLARVTPSEHGRHHAEKDWDTAVRLYREGLGIVEIAEIIGSDNGNVSRALRSRGVVMRLNKRPELAIDSEAVVALWRRGLGEGAIAAALGGTSRHRVRRELKRAGLSRPVGRVPHRYLKTHPLER